MTEIKPHSPLVILVICLFLSFCFAILWVTVMTLSLPRTDSAYGQTPFEDPLVLPVMSVIALVAAFVVFPFTYFSLRYCCLGRACMILATFVILEIIITTPFSPALGFFSSFPTYAVGLVVARRFSPERSANVPSFQFGLRSLLIAVSVVAIFLASVVVVATYKDQANLIGTARDGKLERVEYLISTGADVHARDGWNSTAMMYAACEGHLSIVRSLLKANVPINERSRVDRTPLMWVSANGHLDVVEFLVSQGADVLLADANGEDALILARANNHKSTVNFLSSIVPAENPIKEDN